MVCKRSLRLTLLSFFNSNFQDRSKSETWHSSPTFIWLCQRKGEMSYQEELLSKDKPFMYITVRIYRGSQKRRGWEKQNKTQWKQATKRFFFKKKIQDMHSIKISYVPLNCKSISYMMTNASPLSTSATKDISSICQSFLITSIVSATIFL